MERSSSHDQHRPDQKVLSDLSPAHLPPSLRPAQVVDLVMEHMGVGVMYTEDEAKEKWCPYSNVYLKYQNTGAIGNRGLGRNSEMQDWEGKARCLGSACMAWRWGKQPREIRRLYMDETHTDDVPIVRAGTFRVIDGEEWRYEHTDCDAKGEFELLHRASPEDAPKVGYCGLAGKQGDEG